MLQLVFPFFFGSYQVKKFNLWTPFSELVLPVRDDRLGHNDQEVVFYVLELS
jgi:hypothetical protein